MMSLQSIESLSRQAARKAAAKHKTPYIWEQDDQDNPILPLPFPFIGDYVPAGWQKVGEYFADCSGYGDDDEPALSLNQFLEKLQIGKGYAITEAGEFQVYVGEFVRADVNGVYRN